MTAPRRAVQRVNMPDVFQSICHALVINRGLAKATCSWVSPPCATQAIAEDEHDTHWLTHSEEETRVPDED